MRISKVTDYAALSIQDKIVKIFRRKQSSISNWNTMALQPQSELLVPPST